MAHERQCPGYSRVVTEGEKWRPRSGPTPLEQARASYRDPQTGRMRFRNLSNMFWGYVLAWGLFGMAALLLNKSILTDADPMTPREAATYGVGLFLASLAAFGLLARPFVILASGVLTVRNPLRVYAVELAAVESLESGLAGFPKLTVAGRAIRIFGMEESGLQKMAGGSDDMAVLQAEIRDAQRSSGRGAVQTRWAVLDKGSILLLMAWSGYAISWFVA